MPPRLLCPRHALSVARCADSVLNTTGDTKHLAGVLTRADVIHKLGEVAGVLDSTVDGCDCDHRSWRDGGELHDP